MSARPDLTLGPRLSQLAALLEGGTPPTEAVETLVLAERRPRERRALRAAAARLREGGTLAQALGEAGGLELARETLDGAGAETPAALARLAEFYQAREELRATARAATFYPKLLLVGIAFLLGFLAFVVSPALERLYREMGAGALPFGIQWLLSLSSWVRNSGVAILIAALAAVAAALVLRRQAPSFLTRLGGRLPVVGEALRRLSAAEFLEALALRLSAGCAPAQAYAQAAGAVAHAGFRLQLMRGAAKAHASGSIADGLHAAGAIRPLEAALVTAVEAERPEALARAARRTSRELARSSHRSIQLVGPCMIVILALLVIAIAASIASPTFELASSVGG